MAEITQIDAFHGHEVLHTANIISDMFDHFILGHGFTKSDDAVLAAAKDISMQLASFYQLIGQKTLS